MTLTPIGVIHSPYKTKKEAPRQGRLKEGVFQIDVFDEFVPGLKDIETASHLIILYWADQADRTTLQTPTPSDTKPHGVFATRSPNRPNPINLNVVQLIRREGSRLIVKGLDALDQSPLLDMKPYSTKLDAVLDARLGWSEKVSPPETK